MTFDVQFDLDDKSLVLHDTSAAAAEAAADRAEAAVETVEDIPAMIAPAFSASTTYAAGDYVIYSEKLYQFTSAHAAGAWTGTDADETTVTEKLGGGSGLVITDYDPNDIYLWDDGSIIATGISLNKSSISFSDVGSQTITATLTPSNAQETITWASSDESVATVTGNGNTATVTAVGNGSATITATTDITQLSASCAVTASGLPEEGVRYRFTGTDCTTETSQVVGGAQITFKNAPTVEDDGVLIAENNYMMIENTENWFSGDWTMEIIFEPRLSSGVLGSASSQTLLDAKYGNLYDGTSSNQGQALQIQNPRDTGLLSYGGTNSSLDIRPYNNTECVIKIQYSTSTNGAVYFNGTQALSKGSNATIPSDKNIYFNAFNKSASKFAHVLKSFVIRDGVV